MLRSTLAPESACSRAGPPGYQMSSHTLTPTRSPLEVHDRGPRTLPEVAVLVEDAVVGEVVLVVAVQDLAARDHGAGVVEVGVEVDEADGGHHVLRNLPGELVQGPHVLLDKARAHQEVLGGVAGDGQLGEGDEVGARVDRPLQGVGHPLDVSPDVPDGGVDLGERYPHATKYIVPGTFLPADLVWRAGTPPGV